jgi:hypothetical protein
MHFFILPFSPQKECNRLSSAAHRRAEVSVPIISFSRTQSNPFFRLPHRAFAAKGDAEQKLRRRGVSLRIDIWAICFYNNTVTLCCFSSAVKGLVKL